MEISLTKVSILGHIFYIYILLVKKGSLLNQVLN